MKQKFFLIIIQKSKKLHVYENLKIKYKKDLLKLIHIQLFFEHYEGIKFTSSEWGTWYLPKF